jgi:hypothetical protein
LPVFVPHGQVNSLLLEQFAVRTLFRNLSPVDDQNVVGFCDACEAMNNHQNGFALHQFAEGLMYQMLIFGVGKGGRFVNASGSMSFTFTPPHTRAKTIENPSQKGA